MAILVRIADENVAFSVLIHRRHWLNMISRLAYRHAGFRAASGQMCHKHGVSVCTTVDIRDELYSAIKQRAALDRVSIRSLVIASIEEKFQPRASQPKADDRSFR
jgi:hypothetical protein